MVNGDQRFIPPRQYCRAMQRKMVANVGKAKFDLCWLVFDGAWVVRTGATRFRFSGGYSGEGETATRCSVFDFQP
ncbi:hypothetical protein GmHk_11G031070 [Glycine max]|nr:hypothetical protein GmHk_11G031070 [Glycine max]